MAPGSHQERPTMGIVGDQYTMPWGLPKCRICGRPLSNPKSIKAGIGPICACKMERDADMSEEGRSDHKLPQPLSEGLVVMRDRHGEVWSNVPWLVVEHSPAGFEYGYHGSGPSDLALNLTQALLERMGYDGPKVKLFQGECFEFAWMIHHEIKREWIATIPHDAEHATVPVGPIIEWIKQNMLEEDQAKFKYKPVGA